MRLADVPAGSLALFNEETREISPAVHQGLSAEFQKNLTVKTVPGGFTEKAFATGEMICIEEIPYESSFRKNEPLILREGIHSMVCIPLMVKKKPVGILYLDDFVPRVFDREKLKLLSVFISFAAVAIENAKLHERTKLLAITDCLTGLNNYRHFKDMFRQEIDRAERYGKPVSLLMMDVDNFKMFNDSYGHSIGDQVLVKVAGIIRDTVRKVDHAFRYGGEEFAVILPDTGLKSACMLAERLRIKIEEEADRALEPTVQHGVTVSIGVAAFPNDGGDIDELFKAVDALMYQAKLLGKNQVVFNGCDGEGNPCRFSPEMAL
jgi:diguanylate cyclase (GGDEF)-like protein